MRWLKGITDSTQGVWVSKLRETVKDREAWYAAAHRIAKNQTTLSNWKQHLYLNNFYFYVLTLFLNHQSKVVSVKFSPVQSCSHVQLFAAQWTAARQASLSITDSQSFLKLMSIESVMPPNHLICHLLLLPPSISPSIRVFQISQFFISGGQNIGSFSFSISPSNEYSGLITFGMNWLDLLESQGMLKSLLQHHSSKASILQRSAFFIVQLSHLYMTAGKATALTI